jgi:general secretion pathway protein H
MGVVVRWQPADGADGASFQFLGLPATVSLPTRWLNDRTTAEVIGAPQLSLGPEPVIGAQRVMLRLGNRSLLLATNGLGPFVETPVDVPATAQP